MSTFSMDRTYTHGRAFVHNMLCRECNLLTQCLPYHRCSCVVLLKSPAGIFMRLLVWHLLQKAAQSMQHACRRDLTDRTQHALQTRCRGGFKHTCRQKRNVQGYQAGCLIKEPARQLADLVAAKVPAIGCGIK